MLRLKLKPGRYSTESALVHGAHALPGEVEYHSVSAEFERETEVKKVTIVTMSLASIILT